MYPSEELSLSFYGDVVAAAAVVVATASTPFLLSLSTLKQLLLQH